MEALTKQVMRCLYWPNDETTDFASRPTYWAISRWLKSNPKATKRRMDRLLKTVVKGVRVFPDVSLFGLRRTGKLILIDHEMRRAVEEKTRLLDFVESVHVTRPYFAQEELAPGKAMLEPYAAVVDIIHSPDESLDNKMDLLRGVYGEFTTLETLKYESEEYGDRFRRMSDFAKALMRDPFASLRSLGKKSSVGEAVAQRFLEELSRAGAIAYEPVIDAGKLEQFIFHVGIPTQPERRALVVRKFKQVFPDLWLGFNKSENLLGIVCSGDDLRAVDSTLEKLSQFEEFAGHGIALGLVTIDNQPNLRFLREG